MIDSDPIYRRGDICVIRIRNGVPMMFRLYDQRTYKEWVGCFSYLGD